MRGRHTKKSERTGTTAHVWRALLARAGFAPMASPSGIPQLGDLSPGAHVGQLYRNQGDLLETLVPFFAAGLAAHERCIWVTSHPLTAAQARAALTRLVPDLAYRERIAQIEIIDHESWYTRARDMSPAQVIAGWLSAEEAALRDGYRALRISGNTYWLEAKQWNAFADYEMQVHAAFQGRKIVALCSYALAKCDAHEVVDVLRNHSVSLVRAGDAWEVVHGATAALAALEPNHLEVARSRPHTVELYRDEFPASRVADRLALALRERHAAVAILTRDHISLVRDALSARDVAVDEVSQRHQLALLDGDELAAHVWQRPGLSRDALDARVVRPLLDILALHGHVAVFDELVDVLARGGDVASALELERWWNEQLARHSIDLACGYSLGALANAQPGDALARLRDAHGSKESSDASPASEVERLRKELAQVSASLAGEIARRQAAEAAYEATWSGRGQLVRLDRLAAALGEVTTKRELVDTLVEVVAPTLAIDCFLAIEHHENDSESMLVEHGSREAIDALRVFVGATGARTLWSLTPHTLVPATADSLRAAAVIPLIANGNPVGVLAFGFTRTHELAPAFRALAQDVTRQVSLALDRSLTYERLEHERERAELASRTKDEFLAMLGHELRNPLSPILTATQLMRLRDDNPHDKERVVIERQCKHMMRLVDDLLDVSRITRGKVELRRRAIEISEVVTQAVELASPALEERLHKLTLDVPPSGVVVHADPQRLTQVLCNLLTNAAKYTPPGGAIHLHVHAVQSTVTVSVRDTGIGIDGKLLPHIFDLFVQGRQGIDRASGGLGLGLAIAKSILEMHGGTIHATSEGLDRGSTFTFELPRFANTRPSQRGPNASGPLPIASLRRRRVLVVDDNEDAAFLFSEALKRLGHHVDVAHDGPTALAAARENPPEIAFLDIGLPVMDGYELGRRLLELGVANPPRLVAVTGYGHSKDKERSREAGFDLHLVKPIELAQVQDAIAKLD